MKRSKKEIRAELEDVEAKLAATTGTPGACGKRRRSAYQLRLMVRRNLLRDLLKLRE